MYDNTLLAKKALEMWADGWPAGYIARQILTDSPHLLPKQVRPAISFGRNFEPIDAEILKREILIYMQNLGLCDRYDCALPTVTGNLMGQLVILFHCMPNIWQVVQAVKTHPKLRAQFSCMDDQTVGIAVSHICISEMRRLDEARFAKQEAALGSIDRALHEIVSTGNLSKDELGRALETREGKSIENPFADRLMAWGAEDNGYYDFFRISPNSKEQLMKKRDRNVRINIDPWFAFKIAQTTNGERVWKEDSDQDVVMGGNEPPWGWIQHTEP